MTIDTADHLIPSALVRADLVEQTGVCVHMTATQRRRFDAARARLAQGDTKAVHTLDAILARPGHVANTVGKPVVRPLASQHYLVLFPCGAQAEIADYAEQGWAVWVGTGEHRERAYVPSYDGKGYAATAEDALTYAWMAAFDPDAFDPWRGSKRESVQDLARACDSDRALFVKTIKRIARERFGVKLRVRGGTGTAYGWVHVRAAKDGDTAAAAVVAMLLGHRSPSASIRPCGGLRVAVICRLAGHPLPDGFVVAGPAWD